MKARDASASKNTNEIMGIPPKILNIPPFWAKKSATDTKLGKPLLNRSVVDILVDIMLCGRYYVAWSIFWSLFRHIFVWSIFLKTPVAALQIVIF